MRFRIYCSNRLVKPFMVSANDRIEAVAKGQAYIDLFDSSSMVYFVEEVGVSNVSYKNNSRLLS